MLAGFTQLALTTAPVIALLVWLQRSDRRRIEAGQSPGRHPPRRQPCARRRVAAGDPRRPSHTVAAGPRAPLGAAGLRVARGRRLPRGALAPAGPLRHGHPLRRCGMNTRMLVVVFAGQEAAAIQGLPAVLATARSDRRSVRLACFRPLPAPRVDRHDRVVADCDREMARITETTTTALTSARASARPRPGRDRRSLRRAGPRGPARDRRLHARPGGVLRAAGPRAGLAPRVWALRRRVARRQARLRPRRHTRRGSPSARGHARAGPALTLAIAA